MHTLLLRAVAPVLCVAPILAQEAYLDRISAAPGETVQVFVSTTAAQQEINVYRSFYFNEQQLRRTSGLLPGGVQSTTTGSYAHAPDSASLDIQGAISLEAWVRPISISPSNFAGILLKYLNPGETAYGIYLMPGGQVSFYLGQSGVFNTANRLLTTAPLPINVWTHIVATYDGQTKRIYLNGQLDVSEARTGSIFDTSEPLRVGSFGSSSGFEGDIDQPSVYARALTLGEIETRHAQRANGNGVLPGCVAQFDFEEMVGSALSDATGSGNHLTLVNHATRGIPGPLLPGASGRPVNSAIRFSNVDRYNPGWQPTFEFTVPATWESGFYSVTISTQGATLKLPFIVTPAKRGTHARIAVLANTNTWAAYNSWGQSLYTTNPGGSISRYIGLQQPSPNARLNVHRPGRTFSPRTDAERYLYKWLDDNGYGFDLYGDLDLHRDATLLAPYDTLIISGHSEYWSSEMIDHVEAFLNGGGSLVNLSGNTMWSRVTFNPDFTVMEGRKHPWSSALFPPNERWHSQAGRALGGTWRCIGRPEHGILGTGYGLQTFSSGVFGAYGVLDAGHWAFAGTGVEAGDAFGTSSLNGNAILGHEFDVVHPLWSPPGIQIIARGANLSAQSLDISNCNVRVSTPVSTGGDMIYFDHPGGGGVFGAPTVAFGGSLVIDPIVSRVLANVLDRFRHRGPRKKLVSRFK